MLRAACTALLCVVMLGCGLQVKNAKYDPDVKLEMGGVLRDGADVVVLVEFTDEHGLKHHFTPILSRDEALEWIENLQWATNPEQAAAKAREG